MHYIFKRDTIFATIAVFLLIVVLKYFPLNLHILDPVKYALSDIKFNDLAFSKIIREKKYDENIIIVNIDTAKRKDIAALLNTISNYNTSAIGLDLLFLQNSSDSASDKFLGDVLMKIPNLIVADKLTWQDDKPVVQNFYAGKASEGYINFVGEDKGVIRSYSPFEKYNLTGFKSFTSAILEKTDINKYENLLKRGNEIEFINYKRDETGYLTFDWLDIKNNSIDSSLFKNKTVLIGYLDKTGLSIEDKHYTPLNEGFIHKKIPDMNGVIIHANILSMIYNDRYIKRIPGWLNIILAVLLTHFHISLFINYYIHNHKWFHIRFKAIQLLSGILLIYIGIRLLSWDYYIDFTLLLTAIILSVDVLYFYEGLANWLEKRFAFKTIFASAKH